MESRRRWLFVVLSGLLVSIGTAHYLLHVQPRQNDGRLALQRLGLLYLNEPAPALDSLKVKTLPAVIVFCESCRLPNNVEASIVKTSNASIAKQYGLIGADGKVGPGYAIIDKNGQIRYRTFDNELHEHVKEINIIVRGAK